ncbi:MAG: glycosyltransferase [Anaerolineales bacterium]
MISYHTSPLAALGSKDAGGMNVYVREVSTQLGRMGHQVDIFTRGEEATHLMEPGVRLVSVPAGSEAVKGRLPEFIPEFTKEIVDFAAAEDLNYEVIHAHYWMSGLAAIALKEKWDIPLALNFHTLGLVKNRIALLGERESDERILGERRALDAANLVIASTPAEEADLQWLYELRSAKVKVISPGVDLERFRPIEKEAARKQLELPADEGILLYVGRIEALKGIDTLIRALYLMNTKKPSHPLRVVIVGGESGERLEHFTGELRRLLVLARELGVQERIEFVGSRSQEELPMYYAAADVVAMPSYSESFGLVGLEAMACGRPVVASRVGGLAYLVKDGVTGFHVPEGQPEELVHRLNELFGNPELLERMGKAAREEAEKYSWEKTANEIVGVYEKLAGVATI